MLETTADLLLARAEDEHPGLLFEDSCWTWAQFVGECRLRARFLRGLPGRPAEDRTLHVGVLLDNVPEYLFLLGGCALAGTTLVGVNPTRRGAELAGDIRGTDCDLIVTDSGHANLLAGVDHGVQVDRVLRIDTADYTALVDAHRQEGASAADSEGLAAPAAAETPLLLLFTSGSTGAPKAVVCSTGRLAVLGQLNPIGLTREDVAYNAMPLFHGNALMASWVRCLALGATFAMRNRFSASGFLDDVRRFEATYFNYVGRSLAYVLAQPERPQERDTKLRLGFGTEASARDRSEFARRYGCPLVENYGSSEGAVVLLRTPDTPQGALGRPPEGMSVEVADPVTGVPRRPARFDETGRLANPDEAIGEIVGRGAAARFEGYYNNPDATAERVRGTDYFTGDLGYQDEAGFFWFAGRGADWMRVDGENFAAAPVERVLNEAPGVAVACVYPVADPRTGDQVMAALELAAGEDFDPAGFARFLRRHPDLGTKWSPRFVRIIRAMPLTATRKVDKPRLRAASWSGVGDEPVFERVGGEYVPLSEARAAELRAEYSRHGRGDLIG